MVLKAISYLNQRLMKKVPLIMHDGFLPAMPLLIKWQRLLQALCAVNKEKFLNVFDKLSYIFFGTNMQN